MKRKLFGTIILLCMISSFIGGYSYYNNQKDVLPANVESLTMGELEYYYVYHCRCRNDGACYDGAAISFRPSCAKIVSENPIDYLDCSAAEGNCKQ